MSLVINTNVHSLNAQRSLSGTSQSLARSLQRLASGLRVNSAADDAAGLAISSRMTTQISGRSVAIRNANDGISMLQTAEGSLSTLTENLQRIRVLAVQSANASNSDSDREALQQEAALRLAEVDRIARTTSFNGTKIFSQDTTAIGSSDDDRTVIEALQMGWLENAEKMVRDLYGLEGDGVSLTIDIKGFTDGAGGTLARVGSSVSAANGGRGVNVTLQIDMADFTPPNLPNGGTAPMYADRVIAHEMVHAVMARSTNFYSLGQTSQWFVEGAAEFIHGADERVAGDLAALGGNNATNRDVILATLSNSSFPAGPGNVVSQHYSGGYVATRYLHQKLIDEGHSGGIKDFFSYLSIGSAPTMDQALDHFFGTGAGNAAYDQADFIAEVQGAQGQAFFAGMNLTNADTGAIGGADADNLAVKTAEDVMADTGSQFGSDVLTGWEELWPTVAGGTPARRVATLQIGANVGETTDVSFGAMNLVALGIKDLDLSTKSGAERAMIRVDAALDYVNGQRADYGAQLARLDSTVASLMVGVETGSASRSRILDTDYAAETAELTRSQILQQAGTAMVAQANSIPRNVLSLLSG